MICRLCGKRWGSEGCLEKNWNLTLIAFISTQPMTGGEVMTLAKAIQTSVYERFGILLQPEPVVV